jgi:hypothetical protein
MQLDELHPTITEKEKNSDEMLNCGPITHTHTINTIKIKYRHLGTPTAANILTLVVWQ